MKKLNFKKLMFLTFLFPIFLLLSSCGNLNSSKEISESESESESIIAVSSIKMNETTKSIIVGESCLLTLEIYLTDATTQTIVWSSSDESIATVEDGLVTAVSIGIATITATIEEENIFDSCIVEVYADSLELLDDQTDETVDIEVEESERNEEEDDGEVSSETNYGETNNDNSTDEESESNEDGSINASEETYDQFNYGSDGIIYSFDGEVATVVGYEGESLDIIIPKSIDSCSITKIASSAFAGNTEIKTLTIYGNEIVIEDAAFYGSSSLEMVTFSGRILLIGKECFCGCDSLKIVKFEGEVDIIGADAFAGCEGICQVMTNSLESWCNISFENANSNPVTISHNLYLNDELVTVLEIPNTIAKLNDYAFYSLNSVVSVLIPESVETIGYYAFGGCRRIVEVINKSNIEISECGQVAKYAKITHSSESLLKTVDNYQFITIDGENILVNFIGTEENLILPESYNNENYIINDYAFYQFSNLKSVYIPSSVTSIGIYAFCSCTKLEKIEFAEDSRIESIGKFAFRYCESLVEIVFNSSSDWSVNSKTISSSQLEDSSMAVYLFVEKYFKYTWTKLV